MMGIAMTRKLTLVVDNPPKPIPEVPTNSEHLDIAIEHNYIFDITRIVIHPSEKTEDEGFQLSIKTEICGAPHPLWINVFGSKQFVADKCCEAIDTILNNMTSKHPPVLIAWRKMVQDYKNGIDRLLILPE